MQFRNCIPFGICSIFAFFLALPAQKPECLSGVSCVQALVGLPLRQSQDAMRVFIRISCSEHGCSNTFYLLASLHPVSAMPVDNFEIPRVNNAFSERTFSLLLYMRINAADVLRCATMNLEALRRRTSQPFQRPSKGKRVQVHNGYALIDMNIISGAITHPPSRKLSRGSVELTTIQSQSLRSLCLGFRVFRIANIRCCSFF